MWLSELLLYKDSSAEGLAGREGGCPRNNAPKSTHDMSAPKVFKEHDPFQRTKTKNSSTRNFPIILAVYLLLPADWPVLGSPPSPVGEQVFPGGQAKEKSWVQGIYFTQSDLIISQMGKLSPGDFSRRGTRQSDSQSPNPMPSSLP